MNDSFTSQNSAAFYQAPVAQSVTTDPDNSVVVDTPAASQATQPASSTQDYQAPVQPVQTQAQSNPAEHSDSTESAVTPHAAPTVMPVDASIASTPAQQAPMSSAPVQSSQVSDDHSTQQPPTNGTVAKSSPEEVVRRLAERIKSYQARQKAVDASQAAPAAPVGNVVVTPALSDEPSVPTESPKSNTPTASPMNDSSSNPTSNATIQDKSSNQPQPQPETATLDSEALDAQNIFELLGVMDGSDQEKDAFLDQLQQVIWEDFLENDVRLLLTKSETAELQSLLGQENQSETDRQEAAVIFLEKLIPDLESIMLEKALELKREMVFERVAGMRELHGGKAEVLARITEAEVLFKQDKWQSGARILNAVK